MADTALPKRRPNGTILPGSALNPSGRPRIVQEIKDMARGAVPAAFARVVALVDSPDERVALAASQEILNRAYGKPLQQVNSDVRKLDIGQVWIAGMQAINKRETETGQAASTAHPTIDARADEPVPALPLIDIPADEPVPDDLVPDYVQTEEPLSDDGPVDW
jgi:hypothetical protein